MGGLAAADTNADLEKDNRVETMEKQRPSRERSKIPTSRRGDGTV